MPPAPPLVDPDKLEASAERLPIPEVVRPVSAHAEGHGPAPLYRMTAREFYAKVHPEVPPTRFWGFGNSVPGPTIEVRSGSPVRVAWEYVPTSGDYNADGNNTDYPNVTAYTQKHNRSDFLEGHGVFPICAAGALPCGNSALPAFGSEGNQTPSRFLNPGYADTDLSLKKTTSITERVNLELRLDTFNLLIVST